VAVLIGIQLLAIGFVAEMIAALVSRDRDEFSIAEYTSPLEGSAPFGRHLSTKIHKQDAQ
jgi:hypothetical protein